jgi:hypothetical protein
MYALIIMYSFVMEIMLREETQLFILTSIENRNLVLGYQNSKQRKRFVYYCTFLETDM